MFFDLSSLFASVNYAEKEELKKVGAEKKQFLILIFDSRIKSESQESNRERFCKKQLTSN